MKLSIASVYDHKTKEFAKPFSCQSRGEVMRSWQGACNDESLPFGKFPDDFRCMVLGTFDTDTGKIEQFDQPDLIGSARDFVVAQQKLGLA